MKLACSMLICLFATAGAFAQGDIAPPPTVEEVYLAKDNGAGKAGEQVAVFGTSDIPIHCVVLLDGVAKVTVKMNFVAVSVAGVKPETKVVTASYTTKENQNRVYFTGKPDGKWTPGKYRVDIFLGGKPAKNIEFEIKGGSTTTAAKSLLPSEKPPPKPVKRIARNSPK